MANTYFDMLQAVENYYGSGSDQWVTMANWTGYSSVEVANILKQTPGIDVYTNAAGEIISYSVDGAASSMTAAQATAATAANAINSNALTEAAVQEAVTIPANVTAGATAGTVEITSGATKLAAGGGKAATVLGHVGTAIAGAAIGMKLGVWIDAALYNYAPDYWGEAYNPETWKDYKIVDWLYDYSGYDDFVAHFDEDGQMYLDENLLALYAQYMASTGAFDTTGYEIDPGNIPASELYNVYNITNNRLYDLHGSASFRNINPVSSISYVDCILDPGYPGTVKFAHIKYRNTQGLSPHGIMVVVSDRPEQFGLTRTYHYTDGNSSDIHYNSVPWTLKDGSTVQANFISEDGLFSGDSQVFIPYLSEIEFVSGQSGDYTYVQADTLWMLLHGTESSTGGGVPGINPYDTVPTGITPTMTIPDIINLLKQQYPELWNNAIKQGTLNDDGTITDRVYVPVAVPTGGTDKQPTTDPEHPGAVDPTNEPQTKTAEKIIKKTPEPKPTNPDPGDTGTGETPTVPTPTGSADALYKIYNPTNAQIQSFGAWLWSSNFVDQLLKVFNDPMQAIISLHKIYVTPHTGGTQNIKVGYLDSGVPSKYVDQQYIDVDCGTVTLPEKCGSVLDYEPFVEIRLYLPFIGIVSLSTADVIRATIGVKYRIDVITGTLVATVNVKRDSGAGGVIYQYTGSCCEAYPLSSGSYMGILTGVLGIAAGVAGTIATGGAAAPALLGGAAGLSAMHTKIEHSNGFSGNAGAMACKKPYLIISRQQSAMSNGIGRNGGYPANSFVKLYQCSGLTKVRSIHLESIKNATDYEHDEIIRLLTGGVII